MNWKKAFLVFAMCGVLLSGCGKQEPTDQQSLDKELQQNEFFKELGTTPKNRLPGVSKDTLIPAKCWKITAKDTVWYDMNIGPNEANIPIHIKWTDTLVVVYDIINPKDTVYKPAPYYNGDLTFYYKKVNNKWRFDGLTPAKIEADSADGYVKIDSIQIKVNGTSLPTITSATQHIPAENFPYVFSVGDSITVTVYEGGTLSDSIAWVLLQVPLGDHTPDHFTCIAPGVWEGTWVPQSTQKRWAWATVYDVGALLITDQMAERAVLWGIPYKVQ